VTEEKDRFGDKLRKKEKADEDNYFAEQDRAKLERLRAQGTQAAAALGLCPRCGIPLVSAQELQVRTERCPNCGGIWLDQSDLKFICERNEEGWATRWLRSLLPTNPPR